MLLLAPGDFSSAKNAVYFSCLIIFAFSLQIFYNKVSKFICRICDFAHLAQACYVQYNLELQSVRRNED